MLPFTPSIGIALRFATDTNYPAGVETWSGAATKVLPVATKLTPKEHPAAEELNYLFNDRGERLTEARNDLLSVRQRADAASLRYTGNVTEDLRGATATASGRLFRCVCSLVPTAQDFARVIKGFSSPKMFGFAAQPAIAGNRTPTFVQANNAELVLIGDSPSSYIYDADTGAFSAAITLPGTSVIVDAIPAASGSGWLALCNANLAIGAFAAGLSAPRTFKSQGANWEVRTISAAGAIGADTASAGIAGAEAGGGFAVNDAIRPHLIRGKGSDVMVLFSGRVLNQRYAAFSSDDGATWATVTLPTIAGVVTATIEYCSITEAFVLALDNGVGSRVYNSTDSGVTWNVIGGGAFGTYARGAAPGYGAFTFGPYDMRRMASGLLVTLSTPVTDTLGGVYTPVHVSSDGGVSWNLAEMLPDIGSVPQYLATHSSAYMALGGAGVDSRYTGEHLGAQGI